MFNIATVQNRNCSKSQQFKSPLFKIATVQIATVQIETQSQRKLYCRGKFIAEETLLQRKLPPMGVG